MKITKNLGVFKHTEEYEYTPTAEELCFYYRGTNAGYTCDNPYYPCRDMTVTKRRFMKVTDPTNISKKGQ